MKNARHTKKLPGRNSDVQEKARVSMAGEAARFGLLDDSFQPTDEIQIARTLWRHRGSLVADAGGVIQRMQRALPEMDLQLGNVRATWAALAG